MKTFFSKGQHVMIYQDPLTEKKREGMAELCEFNCSYYDIEIWKVRFIGEERFVQRNISVKGKNKPKGQL